MLNGSRQDRLDGQS